MMGLDFLAECRRVRPNSSRILLTAVLNPSKVVDAIARGDVYRFIAKPWLRNELIATIRDAIERHRLITENVELRSEVDRLRKEMSSAAFAPARRTNGHSRHSQNGRTVIPGQTSTPPAARS
jgi:DNA-binding NtrC family response regulator